MARHIFNYLYFYMANIANMTAEIFNNPDRDEDAKLLCEFWTSACLTEIELIAHQMTSRDNSVILGNLDGLLQLFLSVMMRGQENVLEEMPEDGDKEWDISMAASCTLEHFAKLAGN